MSEFERSMPSFRLAQTHWGDDLQAVAAREMGDANRWVELVWINELTHPYITTTEALVGPGVLMAGDFIRVPAPVGVWTKDIEAGDVFARDCAMSARLLQADAGGDLLVASGVDNLTQQLEHRVRTPRGQAGRHPTYGCLVWRLLGTVNGPTAGAMGAAHVKAALLADYRVSGVPVATAEISGDAVRITAQAMTRDGGTVSVVNE